MTPETVAASALLEANRAEIVLAADLACENTRIARSGLVVLAAHVDTPLGAALGRSMGLIPNNMRDKPHVALLMVAPSGEIASMLATQGLDSVARALRMGEHTAGELRVVVFVPAKTASGESAALLSITPGSWMCRGGSA